MLLGQVQAENKIMAAIFVEGGARAISNYAMVGLINHSESESVLLDEMAVRLAGSRVAPAIPIIHIQPA